jgi:hypothetical protein
MSVSTIRTSCVTLQNAGEETQKCLCLFRFCAQTDLNPIAEARASVCGGRIQ